MRTECFNYQISVSRRLNIRDGKSNGAKAKHVI